LSRAFDAFDAFVPQWPAARWPLRVPRFVGRDLGWDQRRGLADLPG
jgi:hypothetical protein